MPLKKIETTSRIWIIIFLIVIGLALVILAFFPEFIQFTLVLVLLLLIGLIIVIGVALTILRATHGEK
ncbi:MAG: hypothetical protein ACFE9C_18760 [Candidatus Hodarchaeota archaeon]